MKNYITEKNMINGTDGYYDVVIEGEKHLNRVKIRSGIQFFTTQGGYDHNHPESRARENAEAIAEGLNVRERRRNTDRASFGGSLRKTIYFKWFMDSLSDSDKEQYRQMSINQQKDWYISYLEDHYKARVEA